MVIQNILSMIKKRLKKEPELSEETADGGLDEWLARKKSSTEDFLKGQASAIREKAEQEKQDAMQNIEILKKAELRNPGIPEKAKHFMQGNREAYAKRTEQLIQSISIPCEANELKNFASEFDSRLAEYGKATARQYAILKEFFEEEASRIALNIKNLDSFAGEIKKAIKDSKLDGIEKVSQSIESMKAKTARKRQLIDEISKKDEIADSMKNEKARVLREINSIENSSEYKEFQAIKIKLEMLRQEISEKESKANEMFSGLEKPMRKYARISFNDRELLEKYTNSPVLALSQDFGLRILGVLDNLGKAIRDDTIELKDKLKPKALNEISRIDRHFLSNFVSCYAQLKKRESLMIKEANSLDALKRLKLAKESLAIKSSMLDKARKDLESLGEEIGKIDLDNAKKGIIESAKESLGIRLLIS